MTAPTHPPAATPAAGHGPALPPPTRSRSVTFGKFAKFGLIGLVALLAIGSAVYLIRTSIASKEPTPVEQAAAAEQSPIGPTKVNVAADDPIKCSDKPHVTVTAPPIKNTDDPTASENFSEYVPGVGACTQATVPQANTLRILCTLLDGSKVVDNGTNCKGGVLGQQFGSTSPNEVPVTVSYVRTGS